MYTLKDVRNNFGHDRPQSYRITEPIASRLACFLANHTSIHPNIVTIVSFAFTLLAALAFFNHMFLLGAVLRLVRYTLDCVDGSLARITNRESEFGGRLDKICGYLTLAILFAVLLIIKVNIITLFVVPIIIIVFFLHTLQVIITTFSFREGQVKNEGWQELFSFQDLRLFAFTILPLFAYFIHIEEIDFVYMLGILVVLFFVKQLFWLYHYKDPFKKIWN